MSTAIRRVRIISGELGLLSGAHARLHPVRRLARPPDLRLVQPAVAAGVVAEAAADAGEV